MTPNLQELRRVTEASKNSTDEDWPNYEVLFGLQFTEEDSEFIAACSPSAVLVLIDGLERAEIRLAAIADDCMSERKGGLKCIDHLKPNPCPCCLARAYLEDITQ